MYGYRGGYQPAGHFGGPPPSYPQMPHFEKKRKAPNPQQKQVEPTPPTPMKEGAEERMAAELIFVREFFKRLGELIQATVKHEFTKCVMERRKKLVIFWSTVPPPIICGDRSCASHKVPDELKETPSYMAFIMRLTAAGILPRDAVTNAISKQNVEKCLEILLPVLTPIMEKLKEILERPEYHKKIAMQPSLITSEERANTARGRTCTAIFEEWSAFAKEQWTDKVQQEVLDELNAVEKGEDAVAYRSKTADEVEKIRKKNHEQSHKKARRDSYQPHPPMYPHHHQPYSSSDYYPPVYPSRQALLPTPPQAVSNYGSPYANTYSGPTRFQPAPSSVRRYSMASEYLTTPGVPYGGVQRTGVDSRLSLSSMNVYEPPVGRYQNIGIHDPSEMDRYYCDIQAMIDRFRERYGSDMRAPIFDSPALKNAINGNFSSIEEAERVYNSLRTMWSSVNKRPLSPGSESSPLELRIDGELFRRIGPEHYDYLVPGQEVRIRSGANEFSRAKVSLVKGGKVIVEDEADVKIIEGGDLYVKF